MTDRETDRSEAPFRHSLLDRFLGRHDWQLTGGFYYFRAGGSGELKYECPCGALQQRHWPGEYEAGRRLTDEERKALGPYL